VDDLVTTEIRDRVAIVTLRDPKRRNALSLAMAEAVAEAVGSVGDSSAVGAVVLTGAPPAFSAGADLEDLERASRSRLRRIYAGFLSVARLPMPTIAAVNGPAVGAGLNLALACDLRVAARSARFESRFLDLALHPGGGHTWMLNRLVGPQGTAAVVSFGEALDGEAAVRCGLAWSCVEDGSLLDEACRLAARAAAVPDGLARRVKATSRATATLGEHGEAVAVELDAQLWSVEQPEFRERLTALKEKIAGRRKR
jgi:enoyl-CoA hydratase